MKRAAVVGAAVLVVVAAVAWAQGIGGDRVAYDVRPNKAFKQKVPAVVLDGDQVAQLKAGKPVCLLLPAEGGLKSGFMNAVVPFDPVTAWWIIQDIRHFHLVDDAYPKAGSLTDKRRTFMPYVFDGAVCPVDGKSHLYQLLVMPFVAPRKYSLARHHDRDGFPWESAWTATQELYCSEKRNPEMAKFFDEAVQITHNDGCWHLRPTPPAYRNGPQDAKNTFVEYFVDTNPGGNLAQLAAIVNKATSTALPTLHQNLLYHGRTFEAHLAKYHSPEDQARFRAEREAFLKTVGR